MSIYSEKSHIFQAAECLIVSGDPIQGQRIQHEDVNLEYAALVWDPHFRLFACPRKIASFSSYIRVMRYHHWIAMAVLFGATCTSYSV